METPVYDFLKQYAESGMVRLHMPGHKGKLPYEMLREISQYDITEITPCCIKRVRPAFWRAVPL